MDLKSWHIILIVLAVVLLLFIFSGQFTYLLDSLKATTLSVLTQENPNNFAEYMANNPQGNAGQAMPPYFNQNMQEEGYSPKDMSWDEMIKLTELDPSTFKSQQEFIKDTRVFSVGASFQTSIADDNTNPVFTNFQGLNRPSSVSVGKDVRQTYDIDFDVLKRNKPFRFNSTS